MKKPNKPSEMERLENKQKVETIMRDSVGIISQAITGIAVAKVAAEEIF